ncbi:MAG: DUF2007 domain-containing protein [Candidatus Omnitrophica bacterium]|nr:DUF2007 domain-containing protein [Candidatus Omnitrophota bacterium]MCK5393438.1 DUF2007 domain-containing protein [Candidatus Omnitrophota bacterium]MCK5493493.1 DUF2007 domain-containing protein [Candidatus Omnitrophota bacterium]
MQDLVVVRTFLQKAEAELVKGLLVSNGVEAVISSDDLGGYRPHLTYGMKNVELLVRKEDLLKAKGILLDSDKRRNIED